MVKALLVVFLFLILVHQSFEASNLLCSLCGRVVTLVRDTINDAEAFTSTEITNLVEIACKRVPNIEFLKTLCQVVEEDVVSGVQKILRSLEHLLDPDGVCSVFQFC
ncbi:unnamed protein product [Caenorhabditis auriculariae]|uniref:Saposin B-type domain-containing protein n=1 Tax=Caenorhabditis auriculariae TaxID=2777116 RepID=A0A8S1HRS7_9PELO|nr:unnamed protein product [Caenorhabditis auriculariae]